MSLDSSNERLSRQLAKQTMQKKPTSHSKLRLEEHLEPATSETEAECTGKNTLGVCWRLGVLVVRLHDGRARFL